MKTALVLIDIQNDYFAGGANELVGQEIAAQNAAKILAKFRELGAPIFHIRHVAKHEGATFFLPDTSGAQIHALVAPAPNEPVVVKHAPDSFLNTELGYELERLEIQNLVIYGSMSHMCVDTTVRSAAAKGFGVTLAHDACATKDLKFNDEILSSHLVHGAFMAAMDGVFARVKSTDEILSELK